MAFFIVRLKKENEKKNDISDVEAAADMILKKALEAPITAIAVNSGESANSVIDKLSKEKNSDGAAWMGFNAVTNSLDDLKKAGIIDPLKVTKTAFVNALSVAANYLTVGVAITNMPEKKNSPAGGGMEMGGDF